MLTAIILAAGLSSRFGSPKATAVLEGTTTVIHCLQTRLIHSNVDEMIIVYGANPDEIKPHLLKHKSIKAVYNKDYNFGQTSSFQAGLRCISGHPKGVFLVPVDYPLIQTETLNFLCESFLTHGGDRIVIPSYQGQKGHPPVFPSFLIPQFLDLNFSEGLHTVARQNPDVVLAPVMDRGVVMSFNTPEEFQIIRRQFRADT